MDNDAFRTNADFPLHPAILVNFGIQRLHLQGGEFTLRPLQIDHAAPLYAGFSDRLMIITGHKQPEGEELPTTHPSQYRRAAESVR